jgi:hypothetical protein
LNDFSAHEKGGKVNSNEVKDSHAKDETTTKKEKKRSKKKEDNSGLPVIKKPLSAYMLFNNSRRPTLQSEYPSK